MHRRCTTRRQSQDFVARDSSRISVMRQDWRNVHFIGASARTHSHHWLAVPSLCNSLIKIDNEKKQLDRSVKGVWYPRTSLGWCWCLWGYQWNQCRHCLREDGGCVCDVEEGSNHIWKNYRKMWYQHFLRFTRRWKLSWWRNYSWRHAPHLIFQNIHQDLPYEIQQ